MTISLKRLRGLEARFDGPIPPEELRALDPSAPSEGLARALSFRAHHRGQAVAAARALRRGRLAVREDFDFHRRQFRRWNARVRLLRAAAPAGASTGQDSA